MKFGSVRFFKTLILTTMSLLILIPTVLAVVLGILYAEQKSKTEEQAAVNQVLIEDFIGAMSMPSSQFMDELNQAVEAKQGEQGYQAGKNSSFSYQLLYPHLYAAPPAQQSALPNTCYLTFDDGPSTVTQQVLDALAQYDVKATFFVTGKGSQQNPELLKAAVEAGHTVGVHTFSHDYQTIYASVEDFLSDFDKMYREIEEITGVAPQVFRFAGGSVNVFNRKTYVEIVAEMTRRGFVFYDWNAAASDAVEGGIGRAEILRNVLNSAAGQERLIVLMHDRADNASTAAALPDIIEKLQAQGYTFAPLTNEVEPITYYYTGGS